MSQGNKIYSKEDRSEVLNIMVHLADLSNPTKPWPLVRIWTARVLSEFFNQGRMEKKTSLPISPLCDETTTMVGKSQQGFIEFVVLPLWETWDAFTAAHKDARGNKGEQVRQQQQQQHQHQQHSKRRAGSFLDLVSLIPPTRLHVCMHAEGPHGGGCIVLVRAGEQARSG